MAQIVAAMAMTHSPGLTGWFDRAPKEYQEQALRAMGEMRERLARARPDVVVVFSNDHLLNWPINNTPEYTVGIAAEHVGPAEWYDEWLDMKQYRIPGHPPLARYIVDEGARLSSRGHAARDAQGLSGAGTHRHPRHRRPLPRAGRAALLLGGRGVRPLVPGSPQEGRPSGAPARVHARAHGGSRLGR